MSELDYKQDPEPTENQETEEQELGFTDKIVGVFTEPAIIFEKISKYPPKTSDWLVPFLLLLFIVALCNILVMKNPEIKYQVKQKQIENLNKRLTDEVASKKITAEQADQQREMAEKQFDMMDSPVIMAVTFVSTIIFGFIVFILVVGYFYLFAKFVFKEGSSFTEALVANGLASYIGIINIIVATILALVFGRLMRDVSVASLLNTESGTLVTYLLSKLDVFAIWSFLVFSIGLSKMFKSTNVKKYYAMVFGSWIFWTLIFFALSKTVPFFKNFGG